MRFLSNSFLRTAAITAATAIGGLTGPLAAQTLPQQLVRYDGQQVIRLIPASFRELLAVQSVATDIWNCTPGVGVPLDVQVTPEQRQAIEALGISTEVVHEDLQATLDQHLALVRGSRLARDNSWFTAYHTLGEFNTFMDQLASTYPQFVSTFSAGTSVELRPIRGIRVTGPDRPDAPRASRRALMLIGGQHAREWINPATSIYFAHALLERYDTDARARAILDNLEIIVIPIANPDGYEFTWTNTRLWRKNRRDNGDGTTGVDLNRNWSFAWGSNNGSSGTPGNDTYRGTAPFSEPETAALRDFTIANPRLVAAVDVHSFSQLILSPWGSTADLPADAGYFDQLNASWSQAIASVYGRFYRAGPTYTNIYPVSGGSTDWFFGDRGLLAWGIELRDTGQFGFLLPPDQILPTCEENFEGFLSLSEGLIAPLKLFLPAPLPQWISSTVATDISVVAKSNVRELDAAAVRLFARIEGGTFALRPLSASGATYTGSLPLPPCGRTVEFYFEADSTSAGAGVATVRLPAAGAFSLRAAEVDVVTSFTGEADEGFSLALPSDTATSGRWERGVPQATSQQPGSDSADSGSSCWVTGVVAGGSAGANDVDGGTTTLTTARFTTRPPEGRIALETVLTYARWFGTNATGGSAPDSLDVAASTDDGATWRSLEALTAANRTWATRAYSVPAAFPATARTRLRFQATDGAAASTCEAAIDAIAVTVRHCRRSADLTGDGGVGIEDLLEYLAAFDAGTLIADYSNDDGVGIEDLLIYLAAYSDGF